MPCTVLCANHTAQAAFFAACGSIHLVLIDDLQPVIMDILFIYECNILGRTVITSQDLYIILLYLPGLFHDMLIGISNGIFEKILPLCIRKLIVVQFFQFLTEIDNQVFLRVNRQIFISLFAEQADKLLFQFCFALITVRALLDWLIFCDNSILRCLRYNIKVRHILASLLW